MQELESHIKYLTHKILSKDNIKESIIYAQELGLFLRSNITKCYSLNDIEKELIKRIIEYTDLNYVDFEIEDPSDNIIAFIISEPFDKGGHTRLMENLATFLDEKPILFITKKCSESVLLRLKTFFSKIYHQNNEHTASVIDNIIKNGKQYAMFKKIVLNIHPDDIQAVMAVGIAKKLNPSLIVYFVNHADHGFTYGSTVSDVWFEISIPGKIIDGARDLVAAKSFLGIPVKITCATNNIKTICDGDIFITAGTAIKFKPRKGYSLGGLIKELLKKYPNSIIYVIGCRPFFDYWWWSLKLKFRNRLILRKSLPYDKYLHLAEKASVCIDSHPYPGGTAFVEQYNAGKKCIGLRSPVQGYSPVELLKKDTVEEVLNDIPVIYDIKQLIKEVHSFDNVKERFRNAIYSSVYAENVCEKIIPWEGDAFFLENERIVKIPRSYKLFSSSTFHLLTTSSLKVVSLYFIEKFYFLFKGLLGEK